MQVLAMATVEKVLSAIRARERWLLTAHARPDGDAVGSVLGLAAILRQLGRQCEIVLRDRVPHIYSYLPGAHEIRTAERIDSRKYDGAIVLECDCTGRTELEGFDSLFLISIDHHNTVREFADVNWVVPDASAVAELVFELGRRAGAAITPQIATCLYTALLTDTGMFSYVGTDENTFHLAEQLVEAGADPVAISQRTYFSHSLPKMRLLGAALRTLQRDGALTWMHITRDDLQAAGAIDEDIEGHVNYGLGIEGVEVAALFREMPNGTFRVSLRSKGHVDVSKVAEKFGGGGHRSASGHSMAGPLERAQNLVLSALRTQMAASLARP